MMSSPCLLDRWQGRDGRPSRIVCRATRAGPAPLCDRRHRRCCTQPHHGAVRLPATAVEDITWLASRLLAAEALVVSPAVWAPEPPEVLGRHLSRLVGSSLDLGLNDELRRP